MKLIYLALDEGSGGGESESLQPQVNVRSDVESNGRDRVLNCSAQAARGGRERLAITRLEWVAYPRQENVEEGRLSAAVGGPMGETRYRLLRIRSPGEHNQGVYRCRAINSRGLDAEAFVELDLKRPDVTQPGASVFPTWLH